MTPQVRIDATSRRRLEAESVGPDSRDGIGGPRMATKTTAAITVGSRSSACYLRRLCAGCPLSWTKRPASPRVCGFSREQAVLGRVYLPAGVSRTIALAVS